MSTNKYLGVYSSVETAETGSKAQAGKAVKRYWFAWEWDTGTIAIQNMNQQMKPEGLPRILVHAVFESRFSYDENKSKNLPEPPEPTADDPLGLNANASNRDFIKNNAPHVRPQLVEQIDINENAANEANLRFARQAAAASVEDADIAEAEAEARDAFAQGLGQLQQGLKKRAMHSFETPLLMDVPWRPKHKHMFSEFGTTLRRVKVFALALRYHSKALSLSPNEANILFNLARVHVSLGNFEEAASCLTDVLKKKPKLKEAVLLKEYVDKKQQNRKM